MNFIQFLIAFAGLVVGVSAVAILFWYLSKTLKKNVIVRNSNTFTIVHLKELDQYPDLLKNTNFKKMETGLSMITDMNSEELPMSLKKNFANGLLMNII